MSLPSGPDAPRPTAPLVGLLAAAVALGSAELVAGVLPGGRSPLAAVADQVIALTPAGIVGLAIDLLGRASRSVLFLALLVVAAAAGALAGELSARRRWAAPACLVPVALVGIAAGIADPLMPELTAVAAPLAAALAGVLVLWRFPAAPAVADAPSEPAQGRVLADPAAPPAASRREVLVWGASAAGVAVAFAGSGRFLQARGAPAQGLDAITLPALRSPLPPPPTTASLDVDGISPLVTPNDDFFRIDTAFTLPRIDPETHAVRITGMVDRPLTVAYAELLEMADTEADVTITCVSNEVGGDLIGNARWLGVPLDRLLNRAGVQPDATQVVGRAVDGWAAGFPLAVLDGRPALVAVGMNGEPLPVKHGFPVRLVIAGLYGYVSDTKWLAEIELTTFDAFDAYWVRRGWAREGPIRTQSRIDVPRPGRSVPAGPTTVAGVAWAGERGITKVEVAIDDGPWETAELAAALAPTSWRLWRRDWNAAAPGEHVLRVRATDGTGETQTDEVSPPAPDGATGHHTVSVAVT